jgi:hypothetical protein
MQVVPANHLYTPSLANACITATLVASIPRHMKQISSGIGSALTFGLDR